jgi:hypothetical protein
MIDRTTLTRLVLVAAVVLIGAGAASVAVWRSLAVAGGLATGFALGLFPFLSWAWIAKTGFATVSRRVAVVFLLLAKLSLYSGVLYVLVTRHLVHPAGVMAGIAVVAFTFCIGLLIVPRPSKAVQP